MSTFGTTKATIWKYCIHKRLQKSNRLFLCRKGGKKRKVAIQNRRGSFTKFDPNKMVDGEFAIMESDDPSGIDGKSVYIAYGPGDTERVAMARDLENLNADIAAYEKQSKDSADAAQKSADEASRTANQISKKIEDAQSLVDESKRYSDRSKTYSEMAGQAINEAGWIRTYYDDDDNLILEKSEGTGAESIDMQYDKNDNLEVIFK